MAINLAEQYSKQIDKAWPYKSYTRVGGTAKFEFIGQKTVKVYSIDNMPMNDYQRSGSNRFGTVVDIGDKVQEMTVTKDRSFTGTIDRGNNTQQKMIKKAGECLAQQKEEVLHPEMDTYNLNVWNNIAVLNGNIETATLTTSNIYEKFLDLQAKLTNARVPKSGRICFATPDAVNLLKRCSEFTKDTDMAQKWLTEGYIGRVDKTELIEIPESYMPLNSKMILIHPKCTTIPIQLETFRILTEVQGYDGPVIEGRTIYDCFVLDKKKDGLAVLAAAATGLNAYSTAEGAASTNGTFLKYDLPGVASTAVTVKYKLDSSAITPPALGAVVSSGYTAYSASEIAASTNTHWCMIGLDSNNKVLFAQAGELEKK